MFLIIRVRNSFLNTLLDWIDWISCGRAFHAKEPLSLNFVPSRLIALLSYLITSLDYAIPSLSYDNTSRRYV